MLLVLASSQQCAAEGGCVNGFEHDCLLSIRSWLGTYYCSQKHGRSWKGDVESVLVNFEFDLNMASGTDDSYFKMEEDLGHERCVFQYYQNYFGLPEVLPKRTGATP